MQGHGTSVAWSGPKAAFCWTRAIGYCQPNFKNHVMKMEGFFSLFLLKYFQRQKCVCLTKPFKSQEYPADGSLIKYVFIGFTWNPKKL